MSPPQIEAVLAGTKGFALALLAPVTERVGTRPRLASDPAHALVFCRGPAGLVVVEYLGEDSLSAIKDLVLDGEGVRIVAAVPAKHAAADEPLRALGVEPVRWDGTPDGVLGAIERQLASAPAAAAPRPAPPPARAAAARIAPPPPAPKPAAPRAPAPATARPRSAPAARPALTPAKPVVAVAPAAAPASTALDPALEAAFSAIAQPLPPPPAPPPAQAPGMAPDPDAFAALVDELAAAAESLGPAEDPAPADAPGPAEDPTPAETPGPASDAPPPAAAMGAAELFGDLQDPHEFDVDVDEPGVALAAPRADADAPWPTAVPGAVEAADALGRGLLGDVPAAGPLAVVGAVIANLSDLERAVFSGEPQPLDTEPVRRAAVMRVRVALALATAPAPGGAVDAGAVSAFLADIDALLSDVNALAAEAPPDFHASLEAMRNALVKEAIDFSEAVQRAGPAEAVAPPDPAAPRPRVPQTRVLSMTAAADAEPTPRRQRALAIGFAAAALLAATFHGYRYWEGHARLRGVQAAPGLPTGAIAAPPLPNLPGGPRALSHARGEAFDPDELKALAAEEAKKGNVVQEIAPGAVLILPAEAGPPPAAR